jgi:hypothetical protein
MTTEPETIEAPKPQEKPTRLYPVCPHCGLDPCLPEMLDATYGLILVKIFCCPNRDCRKLFNVSTVGRRDPRAA